MSTVLEHAEKKTRRVEKSGGQYHSLTKAEIKTALLRHERGGKKEKQERER